MDAEKTTFGAQTAGQASDSQLHFLDYWRIIRVRKAVILTVFMLVVLTATLVTMFLPEVYQSTARIEVSKDVPDVEPLMGHSYVQNFDPYWMETQFQLIKSSAVLNRVITKLGLQERFARQDKMDTPYRMDIAFLKLSRMLRLNQYRNTSIIEINVFSHDPQEAADIANEIANAYKEYRLEDREESAKKGLKVLEEQLAIREREFTNAQAEVDKLRKDLELNLIDPFSGHPIGSMESETIRRLDALAVEAQGEYNKLNELLNYLKKLSRPELKKAVLQANPDPALSDLLNKLAETEQKRALNEADYAKDHPVMVALDKLLETLERQVNDRLEGIIMGLEAKVASLKANAEVLKQTVEAAKERERVAAEKMRPYLLARENLEHKRQLWNALTLKAASAAIDKQIGVTTVKVVDKAEPGIKPVRPRTTLNIALGVVLGLALGIGLAFFIEYLDTSVKTIDDVERALQAPVLGVIPQNVGNLLDEGPESPHAEAYRVLRTNFLFSRKKQDGNTITIVSGGAGEGKSTTLFNLAVTFAQNGSRVLMVDSDLRRPSLHKMLRVSNAIGLTDYLLKQNTLAEVIQTTPHPNLDFLPSGKLASSALGILSSQAMRELIDELKRRYDYVFFDSPPIMGVSDASVLARTVDYALQVVQYRRYPQPMTLRAKQMIEKVGGNLAGIVLNNINMSQDSYYYYYSGYFEESHYGKSGSDSTKPKAAGSKKGEPAVEVEIKQKY